MRFPLIVQMDFSATYCLIPGFVISFLIGHYQLRGRNRWETIAVSLGLYLLFELLWQVVERRWSDVWVLILGTLAFSCLLGSLAAWAWGKSSGGRNPRLTEGFLRRKTQYGMGVPACQARGDFGFWGRLRMESAGDGDGAAA